MQIFFTSPSPMIGAWASSGVTMANSPGCMVTYAMGASV